MHFSVFDASVHLFYNDSQLDDELSVLQDMPIATGHNKRQN
jgi:hypothetical protein